MLIRGGLACVLLASIGVAAIGCGSAALKQNDGGQGGGGGQVSSGTGGVGTGGNGVAGQGGSAAAGHGGGGTASGGAAGGTGGSSAGGTGGTAGGSTGGGGSAGGALAGTGGSAGSGSGGTGGGAGGSPGTGGGAVTCNPACDAAHTCQGTTCLANDGQSCMFATDCLSNVCTPFYLDADGDGYGSGTAKGLCGTVAPIGYSAMNGDCCDDATNAAVAKLIHPGAGFQTTSANGICGITWDYDCSGAVETSEMDCGSCTPGCVCVNSYYPESVCGQYGAISICTVEPDNSCLNHSVTNVIIGCH